jgi:tissue inhibitor of metalloproteinase
VRGGRVFIAAVSVVLPGLVCAGSALACSCSPAAPAESLARSDAAIVGRLIGVAPDGPTRARYRYEVLRVYRGRDKIRRGSILTVLSSRSSAACALPTRVHRNYGLFLLGDGGRWASGLCGVLSPRRLWLAAQHPGAAGKSGAGASCAS